MSSHPGINQCRGWVELQREARIAGRPQSKSLRWDGKKMEIEPELEGDWSLLGPGVSPCRSASPCTGREWATQGLPWPLSPHPDRASGD